MAQHFRSIFISDVHLGVKDCKAEQLNDFLKHNTCDTLYLVGDIIDGWKVQQNKLRWRQSHTNVIRRILTHARRGTRVVYVAGNHDEFLRPLIPLGMTFGRIEVVNQADHEGADGQRYLVIHGDLFDGITRLAPWLTMLGDRAYDVILAFNTTFNRWRHRIGLGYWSLSKYLKHRVKKAVDFIFEFERNLAAYCKKRGYDGVICGHIHTAEIKIIDGVVYMNDGDWTESCTALVEYFDGRWEILTWTQQETGNVDHDNHSGTYHQPTRHTRPSDARVWDATSVPGNLSHHDVVDKV
jgi:UDP-2,3-diacylglucosamine pyrophosphatase LpxH